MSRFLEGLGLALRDRTGRWVAIAGFAVLFALYAVTLPAVFTGGRMGWVSLQFLTPLQAVIAAALALTLALTLAIMTILLRDGRRASRAAASGSAAVGLITPFLCCSPLLPTLLGSAALVFPALANAAAGTVQGFIATHETEILLVSVLLGLFALYQNARRLAEGQTCRLPPAGGFGARHDPGN